jgi:hypothetical protein
VRRAARQLRMPAMRLPRRPDAQPCHHETDLLCKGERMVEIIATQ